MKITLIFPLSLYQTKQTMPPLGIAWIAAVLRENGYPDVSLIDSVINNYSNEDVINILKKNPPDIVAVSFGTQNRFYAFDLIRQIKKNLPSILIVVGGPCANKITEDIFGITCDEWHDNYVPGEAIIQIKELANGNVAILVAGTDAIDTRMASKVLADYKTYDLSGTLLKITGTLSKPIVIEIA